jgi:hypothetical protein
MQQRLEEEEKAKAEFMSSLINAEQTGEGKNRHLLTVTILTLFQKISPL